MTQRMIKWPSIEQFRNVIRNVQHKARYKGKDENGEAIFDPHVKLPMLDFVGTVKLHGTNASVASPLSSITGENLWVQSRENIITPQKDNAGFAMFVESVKDDFADLLLTASLINHTCVDCYQDIVVYGEWCGKGIQSGVGISELPKMFVIFGIAKVDAEGNKLYLTQREVKDTVDGCREYVKKPGEEGKIFCIWDFPTYNAVVDFERPELTQNRFNEVTLAVEEECPVAKAFGVSGIGEGVVWRCINPGFEDSGFWFKVKGDKHSNSKVKTLATVDVERIENIRALAEKLAHNGRLEQMHQQVFDTLNGGETDIKRTGDFIKAVMTDIFKEEMDTIAASGFTGKDINGPVSKIARDFLMQKLA